MKPHPAAARPPSVRALAHPASARVPRPPLSATLLLGLACFALGAPAQTAAPAPADDPARPAPPVAPAADAPAPTAPEVVKLSPFVVTADDRGYQASHTLSGTRLNTKLEDIGASVTVVTKQQLLDTASLDINDVLRYEASTEGTDTFTTFVRNRAGGVGDQVASDPARANRIRGVSTAGTSGLGANIAWGNFSSQADIPFDVYNIDAVEISRGPNSNLFGLGAASGTINLIPSYANPDKASYRADLRADDWGGRRASVNLNQPIVPGKLGLRVAGLKDDRGFTRDPSYEKIERIYGSLLFRPFKNTTLRLTAEQFEDHYRRPNAMTPRSTIPEWIAAGRPTWLPVTQQVRLNGTLSGPYPPGSGLTAENLTLPAGLIGNFNSFYSRTTVFLEPGDADTEPLFFTVMRPQNVAASGNPFNPFSNAGNSPRRYLESGTRIMRYRDIAPPFSQYAGGLVGLPLYIEPGLSDKSVYDWESVNIIAPNWGIDEGKTYVAELEQIILDTPSHLLAGRAGMFVQNFERSRNIMLENQDVFINIDVNETRLDGSPNPFFLRPYIQSTNPVLQRRSNDYNILSADLAYEWRPRNLPRWLGWIGQQRFNAHVERNFIDGILGTGSGEASQRVVSKNHAFTNPANLIGGQFIAQRYFLGDTSGNNVDRAPAPIFDINGITEFTWFNNRTNAWVTEPVTIDTVMQNGVGGRTRTELRTLNFTAQNFFFKDRLVTTVGWRRDKQRARTSVNSTVDPATGLAVPPDTTIFPLPWVESEGDTKTYGAVVKVTDWLSFHFNKSDSFTPQAVRYLVSLDGYVANPRGENTDFGVSLRALEGKLNLRLTRFDTKEFNSRGSELGTIGNRYLDMEGRSGANNLAPEQSFRGFVTRLVRDRMIAAGNPSPTAAQMDPEIANLMELSLDQYQTLAYSGAGQPQTVGATDISAKGWELEATYNPSRNWRFKVTGSQTKAKDDRVSGEILDWWLDHRVPVWTTLKNDKGELWWTTPQPLDGGRTPQVRWFGDQYAAYWANATNSGRERSQMREWRFAGLGNYEFTSGRFSGLDLGAAVRWESEAIIGFLAGAPETTGPYTGAVLLLDPDKPVHDDARAYFDLSVGYKFRLWKDKIRTKVQLNVRNVFEDGRLQPVAINPDGTPYAFRIVDPRQFILSMSFEL